MTDQEAIKFLESRIEVCENFPDVADYKEALEIAVKSLKRKIDPWNPADEIPDTSRYILLSFSNFSVPLVGRCDDSEEGSAYFVGDEDIPLSKQDVFVNGWMELPKCKED